MVLLLRLISHPVLRSSWQQQQGRLMQTGMNDLHFYLCVLKWCIGRGGEKRREGSWGWSTNARMRANDLNKRSASCCIRALNISTPAGNTFIQRATNAVLKNVHRVVVMCVIVRMQRERYFSGKSHPSRENVSKIEGEREQHAIFVQRNARELGNEFSNQV